MSNRKKKKETTILKDDEPKVKVTSGFGLRYRSEPNGQVLGIFENGTVLDLACVIGDWYGVVHEGNVVYIMSKYAEVNNG